MINVRITVINNAIIPKENSVNYYLKNCLNKVNDFKKINPSGQWTWKTVRNG